MRSSVGVVRDPSPHRAAADLPHVRRPGGHAEVLAAILRIERLEIRTDEDVLVGSRSVRGPDDLAGFSSSPLSQPRTPISPPESPTSTRPLTTSGAIVIVSPMLMSPTFVFQTTLSRLRVERDGVVVERVEEESSLVEHQSRDSRRRSTRRPAPPLPASDCMPLHRQPGLRQVERVDDSSETA